MIRCSEIINDTVICGVQRSPTLVANWSCFDWLTANLEIILLAWHYVQGSSLTTEFLCYFHVVNNSVLQYSEEVLAVFKSYKLDDTQASRKKLEELKTGGEHVYFAKFLTSEKVRDFFSQKYRLVEVGRNLCLVQPPCSKFLARAA